MDSNDSTEVYRGTTIQLRTDYKKRRVECDEGYNVSAIVPVGFIAVVSIGLPFPLEVGKGKTKEKAYAQAKKWVDGLHLLAEMRNGL